MVQVFGNIAGTTTYFDDLCVHAKTGEEHDQIMEKVMKRAQENGVKFNKDKILYKVEEVQFMGNLISAKRIKPLDKYKNAILDMKTPKTKMMLVGFWEW